MYPIHLFLVGNKEKHHNLSCIIFTTNMVSVLTICYSKGKLGSYSHQVKKGFDYNLVILEF